MRHVALPVPVVGKRRTPSISLTRVGGGETSDTALTGGAVGVAAAASTCATAGVVAVAVGGAGMLSTSLTGCSSGVTIVTDVNVFVKVQTMRPPSSSVVKLTPFVIPDSETPAQETAVRAQPSSSGMSSVRS